MVTSEQQSLAEGHRPCAGQSLKSRQNPEKELVVKQNGVQWSSLQVMNEVT